MVNLRLVAARGGITVQLSASKTGKRDDVAGSRAHWDALAPGTKLQGPLMLDSLDATARIEEGWSGVIHASGAVILERV